MLYPSRFLEFLCRELSLPLNIEVEGWSGRFIEFFAFVVDNPDFALIEEMIGPSDAGTTGYTYLLWVRPDAIRGQLIFGAMNEGGSRRVAAMTADGRLDHYFVGGNGNRVARVQSQTIARPGLWYHLAILRTAYGDRQLFINGVLEASTEASTYGSPKFHRTLHLGVMDDETPMEDLAPWCGGLSEVVVYSRALSEQEIHDLYVASQAR